MVPNSVVNVPWYDREEILLHLINLQLEEPVHFLQASVETIVCWFAGEWYEYTTESRIMDWLRGLDLTNPDKVAILELME